MCVCVCGVVNGFNGLFCGFSDKYTRFCQWKNLELNIQVGVCLFLVGMIVFFFCYCCS